MFRALPSRRAREDLLYSVLEQKRSAQLLKARLEKHHFKAIIAALEHGFPELRDKNVIVFLEADNMDYKRSNDEIVKEAIKRARNTGRWEIKVVILPEEVSKYVEKRSKDLQLHPMLAHILLRTNDTTNYFVKSITENLEKVKGGISTEILGIKAGAGAEETSELKSIVSFEKGAEILREMLVKDFVDMILTSNRGKNKVLFVTYYPTIAFTVLKKLVETVKFNKDVCVFVDKAVYHDKKISDIMSRGSTLVVATDSFGRYRRIAHTYIHYLKSSLESSILGTRWDLKDFAYFLSIYTKPSIGADILLVNNILSQIDASPGVVFKMLQDALIDIYIGLREHFRKKLQDPDISLRDAVEKLRRQDRDVCMIELFTLIYHLTRLAVKRLARKYGGYSVESSREVYDHYMDILEEKTGVNRKTLAKILYVFSIYSKLQRTRRKTYIFSEKGYLKHLSIIMTRDELEEVKDKIPTIMEALNKVGFIYRKDYMGAVLFGILRPLLLSRYSEYIEQDIPELRKKRRELLKSIYVNMVSVGVWRRSINDLLKELGYQINPRIMYFVTVDRRLLETITQKT